MSKFDLESSSQESVLPEYFQHPTEGYLAYDPRTLYIEAARTGHKPVSHPITMTGKFFGTKQPQVPTCSEPSEGNVGCSKWYGCPMKKWKHVGPGNVIMEKLGRVDMAPCYHFFETTRGGRATSQMHYGMEGWKLNTDRTTIDVLGRTQYIQEGKLDIESSAQAVKAARPKVWQMEIGDLLPPWWGLQKKKGLPLHPASEHYPELIEDDEAPKKRGRPRKSMS